MEKHSFNSLLAAALERRGLEKALAQQCLRDQVSGAGDGGGNGDEDGADKIMMVVIMSTLLLVGDGDD